MAKINNAVEINRGIKEVVHYRAMEPIYCLVHDNDTIFHAIKTYTKNRLSTGLSFIEVYDDANDLVARALEFGVVVDLEELDAI